MAETVVDVRSLSFRLNGQRILEDVSLQVNKGDLVAFIGPNGGGKTTLLKLMLGLLSPEKGSVRILGKPPKEVAHKIGYVPQNVHINKNFPVSALDVVLMGRLKPGLRLRHSREDREAAMRALKVMGMGDYRKRRVGELSGGQRQRVLIARALVTEPEVLFLDEPTASIDAKGQKEFFDLLKKMNETVTVVVVSHDLMMISGHVKSVACVNRNLFHHHKAEISEEMVDMCHCSGELIAHGIPHRVLQKH